MKQEKSFSMHSIHSTSYLSGRRLQQSILNDYKRVGFGQQSFYYEIDSLQYTPLPPHIPQNIKKSYTHCIWLQNNPFYEVFTLALFEYLLRDPTPKKMQALNKFKNLICNDKFLPFSSYMKGLILKGLRIMTQNDHENKPIAECLLGCEKILAFSECWKELISQSSKIQPQQQDPNRSIISVLATFFDIDLHFYTLKGKEYELEVIKSLKKTKEKTAIVPMILIPNHFSSQNEGTGKEESFSSISSIYGYWSYYILLSSSCSAEGGLPKKGKQKEVKKQRTLFGEYPQLFSIDEQKAVQSKLSLASQRNSSKLDLFTKGQHLISEMKCFLVQLQGI